MDNCINTKKRDIPAIAGGEPVRDTALYYGHQYTDEADALAVAEVVRSEYLTCGPKIEELEKALCDLTGAKYAVACSSDTAALHIACMAAGVGNGDEVITSPITFLASANCAVYCGGKPVFADINPETYNIDPDCIRAAVTDKTKAIVAVDYTGQAADIDPIMELCREKNIILIEDAAHSIGTEYKGRKVGTLAHMTAFSFHPVKTVTSGEGGAVLTDDEELYRKLLLHRSHGMTRDESQMKWASEGDWYYQMVELGYNYRMTDMQAALLISQLKKLPMFMQRRKDIVKKYDEVFSDMPELIVQKEPGWADSVRHLYILRLDLEKLNCSRREFFDAMAAENIMCNVHYIPVYLQPFYRERGYESGLCPIAEKLYSEMMSIPLYYAMSDKDVSDVISAVKKLVKYFGK